jgi:hypothetical protein
MAGGNIGGSGSMVHRAIWLFISCCIIVAVWNSMPHDGKGFWNELGHKSDQLKGVAASVVDWLNVDSLTDGKDSEPKQRTSPEPNKQSKQNSKQNSK